MHRRARDTSNQALLAKRGTGAALQSSAKSGQHPLCTTHASAWETQPRLSVQVTNHAFEAPFNLFCWSASLSYTGVAQLRTGFPSYPSWVTELYLPLQPGIRFWAGTPAGSWPCPRKKSKEMVGWAKTTSRVSITADAWWNQQLSFC